MHGKWNRDRPAHVSGCDKTFWLSEKDGIRILAKNRLQRMSGQRVPPSKGKGEVKERSRKERAEAAKRERDAKARGRGRSGRGGKRPRRDVPLEPLEISSDGGAAETPDTRPSSRPGSQPPSGATSPEMANLLRQLNEERERREKAEAEVQRIRQQAQRIPEYIRLLTGMLERFADLLNSCPDAQASVYARDAYRTLCMEYHRMWEEHGAMLPGHQWVQQWLDDGQ